MADRLEWNGDGAMAYCRSRMAGLLTRAAIAVNQRAKVLLSVPGTASSTGGGGRRKGSRITGVVRSKPGEPPRKQYGRLRASVTYEVDEGTMEARVGTNYEVGKHLEMGTSRGLAPRPWLRRALDECRGQIDAMLAGMSDG